MDRYQRVEKPRPEEPIDENEIRITAQGLIRNYISYATTLLQVGGITCLCWNYWMPFWIFFSVMVFWCFVLFERFFDLGFLFCELGFVLIGENLLRSCRKIESLRLLWWLCGDDELKVWRILSPWGNLGCHSLLEFVLGINFAQRFDLYRVSGLCLFRNICRRSIACTVAACGHVCMWRYEELLDMRRARCLQPHISTFFGKLVIVTILQEKYDGF